jgi:GTP-binding protein
MIDMVTITIKAGDGGDGAVSFHREKFVTRGGPDGGDGGKGGSVYLVADTNTSTLDDFRSKKVFSAEAGGAGKKLKMYGKNGEDAYIKVPVGTLVFEVQDEKRLVADLAQVGVEFLIARGGRGGKGNYKFKSSTNQTPTQYIAGEPGEQKEVVLELKLIADVGLIGLPSAGKSTLINTLTHINAKVAEYHFTTLTPNLGVWELDRHRKVVVADIPGLIEGASSGKGLGDEFLRHIERTKVLVHVVDPTVAVNDSAKVYQSYQTVMHELQQYKVGLWDITTKPQVVVLNKLDLTEVRDQVAHLIAYFAQQGVEVLPISAATGEGLATLKHKVLELLSRSVDQPVELDPVVKKYTMYNLPGLTRRPVLTKEVKGLIQAPSRRIKRS